MAENQPSLSDDIPKIHDLNLPLSCYLNGPKNPHYQLMRAWRDRVQRELFKFIWNLIDPSPQNQISSQQQLYISREIGECFNTWFMVVAKGERHNLASFCDQYLTNPGAVLTEIAALNGFASDKVFLDDLLERSLDADRIDAMRRKNEMYLSSLGIIPPVPPLTLN